MDEPTDLPDPPAPPRPWPPSRRLMAVALWCGFISACLSTLAWVVLGPRLCAHPLLEGLETGALTQWFLLSWALALVPIGFALSLAAAPSSEHQ